MDKHVFLREIVISEKLLKRKRKQCYCNKKQARKQKEATRFKEKFI